MNKWQKIKFLFLYRAYIILNDLAKICYDKYWEILKKDEDDTKQETKRSLKNNAG